MKDENMILPEEALSIPTDPGKLVAQSSSFDEMLEHAEKWIEYQKKFKELSLRATNSGDWIDQGGNPYCTASGAEKIRAVFGLSIYDVVREKHFETDKEGDYYWFEYTGTVQYGDTGYMRVTGSCSSRDPFFAKREGKLLPMAQIDITNIHKSAYTNFMANAVMRYLGLRNLSWDDLKPYGILQEKATKVEYRKGQKKAQWTDEHKKRAKRMSGLLFADADGNKEAAGTRLEELTSFEDKKSGNMVKGKRSFKDLSGKQVDFLWRDMEKAVITFENAGKEQTNETGADQPESN